MVAVYIDAFMTTVGASAGAGPLTSRVLGGIWRGLLRLHRRDSESGVLGAAGPVILSATVAIWVLLLWIGWATVFAASGSVVQARTAEPAGVGDVIAYTGSTLVTLGVGHFVADDTGWRVVTVVASFSGLLLVTLSITYLVSVVSAVVMRRALAIQVRALGGSATGIVVNGWDGTGFTASFQQQLTSLAPTVAISAEQHLAYPVLHYFHSSSRQLAAPLVIATLDEALMLLAVAVEPGHRPSRSTVEPLRFAIGRYLSTATDTSWSPPADTPGTPALAALVDAGVPVVQAGDVERAVADLAGRRTTLHRLVASDGWTWPGA